MKTKRLLAVTLAGVMALSAAGCNSVGKGKDDEIPTLTWVVPGEAQADIMSVMEEANKITEKEIGAKLDMQFVEDSSFAEKMKLNMSANADIDLYFTGWNNSYTNAVKNGGLMDITDLVEKTDGLKEALPDYIWEMAKIDGKIYGVPNLQIVAAAASVTVLDDIAAKYDFDFSNVKTIDDIEPYLEMVKNGEPGIYPYRPSTGVDPWYANKWEAVASYIVLPKGATDTSELKYLYDTEEFKHGAKQLWNWYQKGYIRKDALSIGDDTADYQNGKYAVSPGVWKPGAEVEQKKIIGKDSTFIKLEKPYMTKGKGLSTMISVGANCKHPEKAVEFIKLINTNKELYNLICYGIEGKHYTMENNRVKVISGSGYDNLGQCWKFGNTFNAKLMEGQDDNVWEETRKVNEEAEKSSLLGFVFDNTNVKTYLSNISTIISEYNAIDKGVKDPDTYMDEYISRLKEAGIEKVYDEVKKQLDEYFAKNK